MAMPTASSLRTTPSHAMLHKFHINVKAFGAIGDGVTDDTAAIQSAVTAANAAGGGQIFFPGGDYVVNSTISWDGSLHFSGTSDRFIGGPIASWPGTRIGGSVNGYMFSKTGGSEQITTFENMAIGNNHASGTVINLDGMSAGTMIRQCTISGFKGLTNVGSQNGFGCLVIETAFRPIGAATVSGCNGIAINAGHLQVISCDFMGFNKAIDIEGVQNLLIQGVRIETSVTGIELTGGTRGVLSGLYFEANDTGIGVDGSGSLLIEGVRFHGSNGAPSGQSLVGLSIGASGGYTIVGISDSGTHSTALFQIAEPSTRDLTMITCRTDNSSWSLPSDKTGTVLINCKGTGVTDIIRAPVIATGSLPAAGTGENGRMVIEDNGAGDRNLILYAGGQRFRIDGGSAI